MRRAPTSIRSLASLTLCALACGACGEPSDGAASGTRAPATAFDPGPDVEPLGRPPVVLIVFDALHAGHVGHLGYERDTTPNLDAVAAEGVSFSRAFAPAPYTLASIPSLLTGRRPDTHGVTSVSARLAPEETTLAEICARSGYRTLAAVGNFNGSARTGADQGFEVFREMFREPALAPGLEPGPEAEQFRLATADMFVEFTTEVLAPGPDERPLLLYLHILEPHAPYVMPEAYRDLWLEPGYDGPFASGATQPFIDSLAGKVEVEERDIQAAIALYDGNLRWADHNLGLLRERLSAAGLWDEALVIVTSDHGEAFWQHGRWGHNDHLFDEQVRVPLVIKPPTGRGLVGVVREELVSILDVTPSVCQWLDVAPGMLALDGRSLAALCEDADWRPQGRELFLRTHQGIANLALRSADAKTIVERGRKTADRPWGHITRTQHFDLVEDAGETTDRYRARRARADAEAERLMSWGQQAILERNQRGSGLTPGEVALLRGLGYVDTPGAFEGLDSEAPAPDEH